jgi:hypothetical protein
MAALSGRGLLPASLTIAPSSQDFMTMLGSTSAEALFTVKNAGDMDSGSPSTALTGNTRDFAVSTNTCKNPLAAGATCQIGVKFTPMGQGSRPSAQITASATPGGTAGATLTGTGLTSLSLSPASYDFGPVSTMLSKQFTLTNIGQTTVGPVSVSINSTQYNITSNACATGGQLAPNASCSFYVVAFATNGTRYSATVTASAGGGGTTTAAVASGP